MQAAHRWFLRLTTRAHRTGSLRRCVAGALLALVIVTAHAGPGHADAVAPPASAETRAPPADERRPDLTLDPVVVTATRLPQPLRDTPASLSVVDRGDLLDGRPTLGLDEALPRVPGVFVQNNRNFAQDQRLQIRGFGTRAAFGIREIKVLVDGLPETLPDGQTELDALDLGAVKRIEVLRGPASSLYGNASGGVIQIFTEDPPETPRAGARVTTGSYGLRKYDADAGARQGAAGVVLHGAFTELDGFREHSRAARGTLTAKLRYTLGDATRLTVLLNGLDTPRADDPGALTRAEIRADRRQARALNRQLDAGEEVLQGRIGTTVEHVTEHAAVSAYAYLLYRDFEGRLPILPEDGDGITAFSRVSPGLGARYARTFVLLGRDTTLLAGVDGQHQDDDRRRFANLSGTRGRLGLAQTEQVTGVGPYLRATVRLRDDLEASAGARYDRVQFHVDVDTPADGGADTRTMDAWSPAAGIVWTPRRWLSLFANVGTAFQVPTTTELANPDGPGFNPRLEPQKSLGYEIGAHLAWPELGTLGLSAFYLDLDDTLIVFESPSGRNFVRNAGRSERYGVEADWQVLLTPELRWSMALTFMHAEFRRYRTDGGDFAGNEEPGIPGGLLYGELLYRDPGGLSVGFEASLVDGFFVDDANTARTRGYALVNLRSGYQRTVGRFRVEPFLGLQNLTDATYDGVTRLNAQGGRFFEPAPGITVYGGIAIRAAS